MAAPATVSEKEVGAIKTTRTRTNQDIRAREVRLIDEQGEQLGIVPVESALEKAEERDLDLVEVAPNSDPPVCRIMDFTKYVYDQKRKQKEAKKKTHKVQVKEIKMRPNIDPHDFGIKLKHAREFLEKGHKVKLTIRYRMRELRHYEIGTQVMNKMIEELNDLAAVESTNRSQGQTRVQSVQLTPRKSAG